MRPEQLQAEQPGDKQPELFDIHVLEFGLDHALVAAGLSKIFGLDPDSARHIVESLPIVIKRATSPEEADLFLEALEPLGAVTVLMPSREAIEQALAEREAGCPDPGAGHTALVSPVPIARVALTADGAGAKPYVEWDPLGVAGMSTLATLSLPRAPPPLLIRQGNTTGEIEAPPPFIDPSEREAFDPAPRASHTQPVSAVDPTQLEAPALSEAWLMPSGVELEPEGGEFELEPTGGEFDLDAAPGQAVAALHGEMLLEDRSGAAYSLDLDVTAQGNAHVPLYLGDTVPEPAVAPPRAISRPVAPPQRPPPSAARAPHSQTGGSLPLFGELPPLPDLPPLLGALPALPGVAAAPRPPAPPTAAGWLTDSAELEAPGYGGPPPPPTQTGRSGKASAQDLRRELAANRFAMGEAEAAPFGSPAARAGGPAFGGAPGLELDGPVRRKSRREPGGLALPEPGLPRPAPGPAAERPARQASLADASPATTPQPLPRKGAAGPRPAIQKHAHEPTPIRPGLPLLTGVLLIAAGFYLDKSVFLGNARGAWFLLDGAGLFGLLLAVLGVFRATRGGLIAALVAVSAAYAVNVYAKPLVGYEMQPEEASTRSGEVRLGEGEAQKELAVSNAHLLATDVKGLIRAYSVRELALRGVVSAGGEPDLVLYLQMQDAATGELTALQPDMKRFVGKELRVLAENTMQDDSSRVALSDAERPARVAGGWAVMTEVLPFEAGAAGPPSWRVRGHMELDVLDASDAKTQVRGTFNLRVFWDAP